MQEPIIKLEELKLTTIAKRHLKETSKWCFFLSIIGFVGLAVMFVGAFFIGAFYKNIPNQQIFPIDMGLFFTLFYIVFAIVLFFPVFYLFQFSRKAKEALVSKNDLILEKALEMQKSHYKFIGVFYIINLTIYFFVFVLALMGIAF